MGAAPLGQFRPGISAAVGSLGRIAIETVIPGYDDRKPNATSGVQAHKLVEREDGRLYRALWTQAIADEPDWILISSFNQWHNGTEIEPSVELGSRYLEITQEFARRFKRTSPAE